MNLKRFFVFSFFFVLFPFAIFAQSFYKDSSFVIQGQVKNFRDTLFELSLSTYLGSNDQNVKVNSYGSFRQVIPLQHEQDVFLDFNNELFSFTVQDGDTLTLEWDNADFKNTFVIKGNNEIRTKELQLQLKLSNNFFQPFISLQQNLYRDETLTANDKFKLINELYNRNVQAVFDSVDFFSENLNHLITGLYFQYTNVLQRHGLIPKYKLELALDTTKTYPGSNLSNIKNCHTMCDYTQLNEDWFWYVKEYRYFIYNWLRFSMPFKSWTSSFTSPVKPFNPTLDEYHLAQANIYYTNIKEWFITKSIIDGFGHYAFPDVENVYKQAVNTIKTPYLKDTLQKYYTAVKHLKPGTPAPMFSLKNEKGKSVSLSDFRGKVVYIDFWGVNCAPCIFDIKNAVPELHEHYKGKDVVFLNICVDSKEDEWKKALEQYKLDGVNLVAEGWTKHPVCQAYNVNGLPHYILIDKNGKILNNNAPRASRLNLSSGNNEIDLLLK